MKPTDLQEWIIVIFGLIAIVFAAFANAAPPFGRLLAVKWPRFGEALIRFGADWKNVFGARKLEPGTPSVSAQPLKESAQAVAASAPSVAPPKEVIPSSDAKP